MIHPAQRQALEGFSSYLPPSAQVAYAPARTAESPEESRTPEWLRAHGFHVEEIPPGKDLRFLSLPRESLDAIWCGRALVHYPIEEAQRVIATFFQALRPRTGMFFATYLEGSGPQVVEGGVTLHACSEKAFVSLLRQNGFNILTQGRRENGENWVAVIARRI